MVVYSQSLFRFLIVGVCTVIIDYLIYYCFINYLSIGVNVAKGCGFCIGATFSLLVNRSWTFRSNKKLSEVSLKFIIIYLLGLTVNIFINATVLNTFNSLRPVFMIAFVVSTATSAILNYFGMKFWVFAKIKK